MIRLMEFDDIEIGDLIQVTRLAYSDKDKYYTVLDKHSSATGWLEYVEIENDNGDVVKIHISQSSSVASQSRDPNQYPQVLNNYNKCECGSKHDPMGGHSDWCPAYSGDK